MLCEIGFAFIICTSHINSVTALTWLSCAWRGSWVSRWRWRSGRPRRWSWRSPCPWCPPRSARSPVGAERGKKWSNALDWQKKVWESQNINHVVSRVSVAAQIFCGFALLDFWSFVPQEDCGRRACRSWQRRSWRRSPWSCHPYKIKEMLNIWTKNNWIFLVNRKRINEKVSNSNFANEACNRSTQNSWRH